MTNAVISELVDDASGRLTYRGGRYLLIRPETLAALQRALEAALGDGAAECLASGGRAGGGRAVGALAGTGRSPSGAPAASASPARERVESLAAMGTAIGWGRFTLERFGSDAFVITVTGSPFAEAYGAATAPVCHLTRGVLETLASTVFARPAAVTESACIATGAPACRFEARPVPQP